jgi:hypothetical protein
MSGTEADREEYHYNTIFEKVTEYTTSRDNVRKDVNNIVKNIGPIVNDLTNDIKTENVLIENKITQNESKINKSSTSKFHHQIDILKEIKHQNYILFIIFYVLVCILGVVMFYYESFNMLLQIIIFHVLLVFPFIIYYLELLIYSAFKYTYAYTYGIPYEKVYFGEY